MTAQARSRAAILVFACLAHVGLILLLANGFAVLRYPVPTRDAEPLLLTLLDLVRPDPSPAEVPAPVLTPPSEIVAGPVPEIESTGSAFARPVSDSVPRVDWVDERRREVAHVVDREARPATAGCVPAGTRARTTSGRASPEEAESRRFDRVAALTQDCEPPRRAQHVVQ